MKVNLFTSFYIDKQSRRQDELEFCVKQNSKVGFDNMFFFIEHPFEKVRLDTILDGQELNCKMVGVRPTFNDFFQFMDAPEFSDSINVLCNSDIFFQDLQLLKDFYSVTKDKKHCLALSRWDATPNGYVHFDRADSQDTWVFYGNPTMRTTIDFTMGVAGCDNRLAHEILQNGYSVSNPSKTIKSIHFHETNIRNYLKDNGEPIERVPPPYHLIPTT
jgi:hypothetical protein